MTEITLVLLAVACVVLAANGFTVVRMVRLHHAMLGTHNAALLHIAEQLKVLEVLTAERAARQGIDLP